MRFGAHLSTAKGYGAMAEYARDVGCECVQVFAKSPRQWMAKALAPERVREMRGLVEKGALPEVITHTSYLINLATSDEALLEKSIDALADELARAALLGVHLVNTHVGAADCLAPKCAPQADECRIDGELARACERVAWAIRSSFERAQARLAQEEGGAELHMPTLLLEDTAGAGHVFGSSMAELACVIGAAGLGEDRLGICIDTCHAWAAGYDLSDAAGWDALLGTIDGLAGLRRLRLLHVNDCLHGCGEHRDRHAWIGRGQMGIGCFAAMCADPRLVGLPAVLEMPGEPPVKDALNIGILKDLREGVDGEGSLARARRAYPDARQ